MARKSTILGVANAFASGNLDSLASGPAETQANERSSAPLATTAPVRSMGSLMGQVVKTKSDVQDLPVNDVLDSELTDRLVAPTNDPETQVLAQDIREHGQLLPIMVRADGLRYRIVYGRRRLAAARLAGLSTIKAFVREDLSLKDSLALQGRENAYRKDLVFIEKALFAASLLGERASFTKDEVAQILNLRGGGDSVISKMKAVVDKVGEDVIRMIGPANAGRDAWYEISQAIENKGFTAVNLGEELGKSDGFDQMDADQRFKALARLVTRVEAPTQKPAKQMVDLTSSDGSKVGIKASGNLKQASIIIKSSTDGLAAWVAQNPDAVLAALEAARKG